MVRTGPDGALWIADMYRHVIEHPKWIPAEWQAKLDLRAGSDKGRIYRVYTDKTPFRSFNKLDELNAVGLVDALDSPLSWQRDLAQQMLIGTPTRKLLNLGTIGRQRIAATGQAAGTMHPGWAAIVATSPRSHGVQDASPAFDATPFALAEKLLAKSPELGPEIAKLADDSDPQVQMQVAYSLGEWNDPRADRRSPA